MSLEKYIEQLRTLEPSAAPLWGSMNAQQMVEHLSIVTRVSNGKWKAKLLTPPEKLERFRTFLFSDQPMPQNFKAPFLDDSTPLRNSNINEAIIELEGELKDFHKHFEEAGRVETHPIFGELNYENWIHFHHKHFSHHLKQFGLM